MALQETGVNSTIVKEALGAGSHKWSVLCKHANINKWSKWKPVRFNKEEPLVANDIRGVKAGLSIPSQTSETAMMSAYRGDPIQQWIYLKPRGGNNNPSEPYRIGDFRNYEHGAQRFYDVIIPDKIFTTTLGVALNMTSTNAYWINWSDLQLESNYFGILVVKKGNTTPYNKAISTQTLSDSEEAPYVEVSLPSPVVGDTYEVFSFISETINGPFLLIENGMGEVSYLLPISVTLEAYWNVSYSRINWTLIITNNSGASFNISGGYLYVRYGDNLITDPIQTGEYQNFLTSPLTVPAGGLTLNGYWDGLLPNYNTRGGYVYFGNSSLPQANQSTPLGDPS